MTQQRVKIKSINRITHDVLQITTKKPAKLSFIPGQAIALSVKKSGWENEVRPFTFTSLPENTSLEFIIKIYPSHYGVTNELQQLKKDDEIILHNIFGAISYKGEGVFIAGGAGITPFISIFRDLHLKNEIGSNKLIFANKTKGDIILEEELKTMLKHNFINIIAEENIDGYAQGLISESFLKAHISRSCKNIYLCGPPEMMESVEKHLHFLNIDKNAIIKEEF
ncbi:MAG: flavodoxin reductase [Bacteroidetes bacterium HGW-Bacteroidetes-15]|nr:MAG: flavodoxin reductase [Bacteroidetes bacterium HGW-Bacteroidetes-15]